MIIYLILNYIILRVNIFKFIIQIITHSTFTDRKKIYKNKISRKQDIIV